MRIYRLPNIDAKLCEELDTQIKCHKHGLEELSMWGERHLSTIALGATTGFQAMCAVSKGPSPK